jgi:hypothetical protein
MTQLLDRSIEQRFIQTSVSWESFKAIQSGLAGSARVRLFYYERKLEITRLIHSRRFNVTPAFSLQTEI